jgi:energy-converting hydrogenase Eha subunit A
MVRCILAGVLVACGLGEPALGQSSPKVQDMKRSPRLFVNEVVRIEGFVTQYVEGNAQTTRFFFLKDDWGGFLKVRTSRDAPEVGHRYAVTGPIGIDPRSSEIYLSEESRVHLEPSPGSAENPGAAASAAQPPPATVATEPVQEPEGPEPARGRLNLALVVILAVVLLGLIIGLILVLSGRRRERPRTSDFAAAASLPTEAPPAPQQVIEGRTIKMHAPPPGTLKLLPGWLEVVAGDDVVKEIRFYRMKGEVAAETTFGRATGRPFTHIQLKPMTVSARQAAILFDGAAPKLTNFASNESNPTSVNGRDLGVNESVVLSDGDKIKMGEVSFVFHVS